VLLTALQEFNGTVVFVSHDRYFIDKLATRVIEVADGQVHVFPGNYEEYLWRKQGAGTAPVETKPEPKQESKPKQPQVEKPSEKDDRLRRLNPIKLRQMRDRQRAIEDEITRLEVEIADFEQALSSFQSAQHSVDISELLESRRQDMTSLLSEWEDVSETIEANR
jgi:ATP-binding cassette subfamily F protein 3